MRKFKVHRYAMIGFVNVLTHCNKLLRPSEQKGRITRYLDKTTCEKCQKPKKDR